MTDGIVPITLDERRARIEKARRLMADNRIDAILVEGGTSMFYFTGVRWGQSERPFVAVIPAKGEFAWVCPGFEEARARELIKFGDRHPHLAGRREPVPRDRADLQGPRHRHRPHRRRGAAALLHHERRQDRGAGARLRQRRSGHGRLPHDQVAGRDRADAARERHDDRRLQGRARDAARRDDAGRSARQHPRRLRRHRRAQPRRRGQLRRVHRVPARQRHAAATEGRRRRPDRRRLHGGRLLLRHHAHGRLRQADQAADRRVEPRAPRAGRPRSPPRSRACRAKRSTPPRAR